MSVCASVPECAAMEVINLAVGGLYFCLSVGDIKRFPDSYFAHLLKDEWNADRTPVVVLDRDGLAFRHVHYYLYTGYLDTRDNTVDDFAMLLAVKREADFYNLPYSEHKRPAFLPCNSYIDTGVSRTYPWWDAPEWKGLQRPQRPQILSA